MIIISTSLTVPAQPSPQFHGEAWLPFRNREMDYCYVALRADHLTFEGVGGDCKVLKKNSCSTHKQ